MYIFRSMASWRYIFHPHLRQTYVPVARLPGEHKWRKICVPLDLNVNENHLQGDLCLELREEREELDENNISSSEVWLAQGYFDEIYLNNRVEGNCPQFGRILLLLDPCFHTKGKTRTIQLRLV